MLEHNTKLRYNSYAVKGMEYKNSIILALYASSKMFMKTSHGIASEYVLRGHFTILFLF